MSKGPSAAGAEVWADAFSAAAAAAKSSPSAGMSFSSIRTIWPDGAITVTFPPSDWRITTSAPAGRISFSPDGIWVDSTSRVRVQGSLYLWPNIDTTLTSFLLGGDGVLLPFQGGLE